MLVDVFVGMCGESQLNEVLEGHEGMTVST